MVRKRGKSCRQARLSGTRRSSFAMQKASIYPSQQKMNFCLPDESSFFHVFEPKSRLSKENHLKIEVGVAKNAAPTLFLCLQTAKMLVYFCSFYAAAKSEEKVQTERFEHSKHH